MKHHYHSNIEGRDGRRWRKPDDRCQEEDPAELRSARWFAPDDLRAFGHRSRAMQMGYAPEDWVGRPVIAILNTWSDAQPCHMHFKSRVEDVEARHPAGRRLPDGTAGAVAVGKLS